MRIQEPKPASFYIVLNPANVEFVCFLQHIVYNSFHDEEELWTRIPNSLLSRVEEFSCPYFDKDKKKRVIIIQPSHQPMKYYVRMDLKKTMFDGVSVAQDYLEGRIGDYKWVNVFLVEFVKN